MDFCLLLKNIGTHTTKVTKNMSIKYSQQLLDSTKKCTTDGIKTASKRAIQKIVEATGDLTGNKIVDKITIASKSSTELHSQNDLKEVKTETFTKRNIYMYIYILYIYIYIYIYILMN